MAEKRDYYEVLGLSKSASDDEIKKAYRKLAKEHHPDLNPDSKESEHRFKEINEAYEILSDKEKKARYDQFGHAGVDPSYGGGAGGYGGFGGFDMGDIDLGDLFGSFFGGGSSSTRRTGPRQGENLGASITITFEEAAFGCEKELNLNRTERCQACSGSGAEPGTTADTCPDCRGSGTVRIQRGMGGFAFSSTAPCERCRGTGKIIHSPCKSCHGAGNIKQQKRVKIPIPAGIDDGQGIRVTGQGNAGANGGPNGDLIVTIRIRAHKLFHRDGTNILYEHPITFYEAAMGAELEIPTLHGKVKYNLPAGTQTGTTFRLRGQGVPIRGRGDAKGDQYVTVTLKTPTGLNGKQKDALRAFAEAMGEVQPEGVADGGDPLKDFFGKRKKKK